MLNWMDTMAMKARLACLNFVKELKNDERGLSGVVVAVLLILVAVLAIVMLWGLLGEWIGNLWNDITGKATAGLQ